MNLYAHLFAKADNFMRNFKIITDTDRETHIRKYINISDVEKCDLMNTKSWYHIAVAAEHVSNGNACVVVCGVCYIKQM